MRLEPLSPFETLSHPRKWFGAINTTDELMSPMAMKGTEFSPSLLPPFRPSSLAVLTQPCKRREQKEERETKKGKRKTKRKMRTAT